MRKNRGFLRAHVNDRPISTPATCFYILSIVIRYSWEVGYAEGILISPDNVLFDRNFQKKSPKNLRLFFSEPARYRIKLYCCVVKRLTYSVLIFTGCPSPLNLFLYHFQVIIKQEG